jgi:hypothetical protein
LTLQTKSDTTSSPYTDPEIHPILLRTDKESTVALESRKAHTRDSKGHDIHSTNRQKKRRAINLLKMHQETKTPRKRKQLPGNHIQALQSRLAIIVLHNNTFLNSLTTLIQLTINPYSYTSSSTYQPNIPHTCTKLKSSISAPINPSLLAPTSAPLSPAHSNRTFKSLLTSSGVEPAV